MKQIIKKGLIIAIYIGLILINTNVYATSGKTTNETTRLRKEASTSSDTIILISQNTDVEIVGEEGEWYQVSYSNYTGYIRKDMLSVSDENTNTNSTENTNSTASTNENNETSSETQNEVSNTASTDTIEKQQNDNEISENANNTEVDSNIESNQNTQTEATQGLTIGYVGKLTSSLDIKILPSINSSVIAQISENTDFTVTDIMNKWCYIETQDNSGWALLSKVNTNFENNTTTNQEEQGTEEENTQNSEDSQTEETSVTPTEENKTTVKYVSAETLNVRESTDNNADIISQLDLNTQVTVLEVVDSTWSKITVNGKTGYVASKYLSDTETTISSRSEDLTRENSKTEKNNNSDKKENSEPVADSSNSNQTTTSSGTTAAEVASYAKQYLGYKYVSGGTSPSTGFDCSGFTYYVYKHFGITLSRTSTAQASNGTSVSKSNLQAGDLVIFNNSSNSAIGHVGIYIGGNKFIHAANSTKGVITTSLSDSYYKPRFVSARRIIN